MLLWCIFFVLVTIFSKFFEEAGFYTMVTIKADCILMMFIFFVRRVIDVD